MQHNNSVLIVEDEAVMAMYLQIALKRAGINVSATVSTGEEAIEVSSEKRPDVVLMDIRLAGELDGISAAKEIQKEHNSQIIFMTGYSNEETMHLAEEVKPLAYLVKPFDMNILINKLRENM